MPAEYFVAVQPGMPVPGRGFIPAGHTFEAPAGFLPPLSLFPVNEAALAELTQAFDTEKTRLEGIVARGGPAAGDYAARLEVLAADRRRALQLVTAEEIGTYHSAGVLHFRKGTRQ